MTKLIVGIPTRRLSCHQRGPRWGIWESGDWTKKVGDLGDWATNKVRDLDTKWEQEQ